MAKLLLFLALHRDDNYLGMLPLEKDCQRYIREISETVTSMM
jgi:hypothetical protein